MLVVCDFDRTDDEDVLGGKEFMTALAPTRDFVEDSVGDEAVEDLAEGRQRGERFSTIAPRVDNLHGGLACLHRRRRIPFSAHTRPIPIASGVRLGRPRDVSVSKKSERSEPALS